MIIFAIIMILFLTINLGFQLKDESEIEHAHIEEFFMIIRIFISIFDLIFEYMSKLIIYVEFVKGIVCECRFCGIYLKIFRELSVN